MDLIDEKCHACPAFSLRTPDQIKKAGFWHGLFLAELNQMESTKVILLGESYPANRYFYDLDSNYESGGLMYNLKQEFGIKTNREMLLKFRELGVLVYDCAFCPLHLLDSKTDQRHSATHCLKTYKLDFLNENNVPIITFFPAGRRFLKRQLPEINSRIVAEFKFNSLQGIKDEIINICNQIYSRDCIS